MNSAAWIMSYKAWVAVVLEGLSFSNCFALLALDFDIPVS
jgi:hypothetical protein